MPHRTLKPPPHAEFQKPDAARSVVMRKLLIGLLAAGLVLGGMLLALVMPRHCPVTRAACGRIQEGMTQAEVEKILGVPPGDYRTRPVRPFVLIVEGGWCMVRGSFAHWMGDEAELDVCFDGGVVVLLTFTPLEPADVGPVAIATWRLKRLKERWHR
jgi:hypothetical protein